MRIYGCEDLQDAPIDADTRERVDDRRAQRERERLGRVALVVCAVAVDDCGLADRVLATDRADERRRCAQTSQVKRKIHVIHNLWRPDLEDRGPVWKLVALAHGVAAVRHDIA
jgi:hypothetical protein